MRRILMIFPELFNRLRNRMTLRYRHVSVAGGLTVHGHLKIFGHGQISLGKDVTINSSRSSNPIGGDTRTVFSVVPEAKLTIGDRVGISNSTIVCHHSVTIGNDVMIGGSVKIYDTDFHRLTEESRATDDRKSAVMAPVVIRDRAFIGAHSLILKGVTIGEGAVIGAGSVVTKNVPDGETWAGNPAGRIDRTPRSAAHAAQESL